MYLRFVIIALVIIGLVLYVTTFIIGKYYSSSILASPPIDESFSCGCPEAEEVGDEFTVIYHDSQCGAGGASKQMCAAGHCTIEYKNFENPDLSYTEFYSCRVI